jgi:transposase-like protein
MEDIMYLFLDAVYLGVRGRSREKEAILVAHGINREGKRVVLHLCRPSAIMGHKEW